MTIETRLSIDKISITARDPDSERVKYVCRKLQELGETDLLDRYKIKPGRWRHIECSVPVPISNSNSGDHVRFEVGARHEAQPDYRFEYNPAKIAPTGITEFLMFMKSNTGIDLDNIISNGIVTRIDLALDLYDLSLETIIVRSRGAQKVGLYSDRYGNPEWVALGSPRSNRTIGYSKVHDGGRGSVRLERRMKPRCVVHQLTALCDPFTKAQLIATESFLPFLDGIVPEHFFDSIRIRGLSPVINKLPPGPRRAIKEMLRDPAVSVIPSTEEIWKGWPQLLEDSGFGLFLIPFTDPEVALAPEMPELAGKDTAQSDEA
jgi:hypothetical protein